MQPPPRRAAMRGRLTPAFAHGLPLLLRRGGARAGVRACASPAAGGGGGALVVVESPAKAATIQRLLPAGEYRVVSCVGHVRELPSSAKRVPARYKGESWARLGVDVDNGFAPLYVLIAGKGKVVSEMRAAMVGVERLILATDEDREGEAIASHLVEVLRPSVPVRRAVFHEITAEAVERGIRDWREIDTCLVQAQEARRVVDRLAGYTMSPLLWKKIARGLSAGRVQSVAMSLVVHRELERLRFVRAQYCDVSVELVLRWKVEEGLTVRVVKVDGKPVAKGADFDGETGELWDAAAARGVVVLDQDAAFEVVRGLGGTVASVERVVKRRARKNPPRPFVTSTLQQECGNKFGMSAGRVMSVAQRLYENGHITYMRTDSAALSTQAVAAAREVVVAEYGEEYLGDGVMNEKKKKKGKKGEQGAHEAIRPAGVTFRRPEDVGLEDADELRVYTLIYKRTLASQMARAEYDTTTMEMNAEVDGDYATIGLRASGRVVVFHGFLKVYREEEEEEGGENSELPDLSKGDMLSFCDASVFLHETKPRARFTDASLVKELEVRGVGRPSTYASIIEKLVDRSYVFRGKALGDEKSGVSPRSLVPSLTAFAVERLLSTHFPEFVDPGFTAKMEERLDRIADGKEDRVGYLTEYYHGESGLAATVERNEKEIDDFAFRKLDLPNLRSLPPPPKAPRKSKSKSKKARAEDKLSEEERSSLSHDEVREIMTDNAARDAARTMDLRTVGIMVGPHGPYLEGADGKILASLPRKVLAHELSEPMLRAVIELAANPFIGFDPDTAEPIWLKTSKYGPYVERGVAEPGNPDSRPKRVSLLPGMDVGDIDVDTARKLLSLPRLLGEHPVTGLPIRASRGPYGFYVVHETEPPLYASLRRDQGVFDVTWEDALALINAKEERKRLREEVAAAKAAAKAATEAEEGAEPVKAATKAKKAKTPRKKRAPAKAAASKTAMADSDDESDGEAGKPASKAKKTKAPAKKSTTKASKAKSRTDTLPSETISA